MISKDIEYTFKNHRLTPIFRYIDRQYELQGYRIPLPESEELNVPDPVSSLLYI